MLVSSKFNAKTNPIGTQNLEVTYLQAADSFLTAQLYANVILSQPNLDISQLDPGLATLINAFQGRMSRSANFFLTNLMPAFISSATDGYNFGAVVNAGFSIGIADISGAYSSSAAAKNASALVAGIANQADTVSVNANSFNASFSAGEKSINTYSAQYNESLNKAIAQLGSNAQQIVANIDELKEAIAQNIADIVEGGKEVGSAVSQLGTGLLTTITGAAQDPGEEKQDPDAAGPDETEKKEKTKDPKKKDDPKPGKDEDDEPDVEFAVQAIQAGISGETKASAAMLALNANNVKLAAAYQLLAQENVLVTIAKVTQVQNQLFLDAFNQVGLSIHDLNTEWADVDAAYSNFENQLSSVQSQAEATGYATEAQGAKTLWNALIGQLNYIKTLLTAIA